MHSLINHPLIWTMLTFGIGLVTSIVLTPVAIRLASRIGAIDHPGPRKIHAVPVPRNGGLAIAIATLLAGLLVTIGVRQGAPTHVSITLAVAICGIGGMVLAVGLLDDIRNIPSSLKLLTLLAGSAAVVEFGVRIDAVGFGNNVVVQLHSFAFVFTVLWIVAITVGINFIDGLDGLAGGVSATAAFVLAIAAAGGGAYEAAILLLALAGGISGFLFFNVAPARVFMGDCGSMFVGFMLGTCSALASSPRHGHVRAFSILVPAVALSIPLLDSLSTVVRRGLLQRRSIFSAERGHIHHRLVDAGMSKGIVTLLLVAVTATTAALSVTLLGAGSYQAGFGLAVSAVMVIVLFVGAGSLNLFELSDAISRNRALHGQLTRDRKAFEESQLRFRNVRGLEEWWTEVCNAAEALGFSRVVLPMAARDGTQNIRRWWRSDDATETMRSVLPIRQRRSGDVLEAEVVLATAPSLELAAHRLALFSRLMQEHDLTRLPAADTEAADKRLEELTAAQANEPGSGNSIPDSFITPADSPISGLRVAVVHDFLYCYGGAERVLESILHVFPQADIFSLFDFLPPGRRGFIFDKPVNTSFIQHMPMARRNHRVYLPLMPLAVEQLDVSAYDIVISSSYCVAKGVLTRPGQLHVCYCHSPARFAWDLQNQYLGNAGLVSGVKSFLVRAVLQYMRNWDTRSANGVDLFLTNSHFVSQRVDKYYRRRSIPLYPPVTLDDFRARGDKDNYYITVSRLVPYKRVDLIVEAFAQMPDRKLIVIGDGPEFERLKLKATPNIQMLGQQSFSRLRYHLENARAFVFAAEEDFGIAPVEAQACGTPVIAYGRGGALESVVDGKTGIFFEHQTPESLAEAVVRFEAIESWDTDEIRKNAERFSTARFHGEFFKIVEAEWTAFCAASEASKAITTAATNVDPPIPSKWLRLHRTGDIRSAAPVNVSEHRAEDPDWSSDSALEGVA